MVGWHHRLDGHEFEQALGVGDGQGGLVCYSKQRSTRRPVKLSRGAAWLDPHLSAEPVLSNSRAWRSEAKQTQTREFGTEKCLLQNQERSTGFWLGLKNPKFSSGFWRRIFTGKCIDFRVCELLSLVVGEVTGRCAKDCVLSLKLPSSTWVGALIPAEDISIYMSPLRLG